MSVTLVDDLSEDADLVREERRSEQRLDVSLQCTFVLDSGDIVAGAANNVSASGVALSAEAKPVLGSKIHLKLEGGGVISGKVIRNFPGGFAVSLPEDTLTLLTLTHR